MKSMLCLGIAIALIGFAMFPKSKPSGTPQHLNSVGALIDGKDGRDCPPFKVTLSEPDNLAIEADALATADAASPERVDLRRADTFECFHWRQEHEFGTVPLKFGVMRMSDIQSDRKYLNHSASGYAERFRLCESESGAVLAQIESRPSDNGVPQVFVYSTRSGPQSLPIEFQRIPIAAFDTEPCYQSTRNSEWELVRMDLIGWLKHETPVAYVALQIPRMEEVNDTPTIPLNEFEQRSIDALRANANQDIVLEHTSNEIRMVGALRARSRYTCTRCHDVREGDMLGAFTYRFELRASDSSTKNDE